MRSQGAEMIDDELQVYPHLDLDASSTATLARVR